MLTRAMPILQVKDVVVSVAFYEGIGFTCHGMWDDPPSFAIVQRGTVTLGLDRSGNPDLPTNQWWAAYLYVDDVDALHAEFKAVKGLEVSAPENKVYGCRDFDIVDCDGHRIAFGQDLNPEPYGSGLGPINPESD
ncbi:MAG: VOC family protein [Pseudomonadota bacterium]